MFDGRLSRDAHESFQFYVISPNALNGCGQWSPTVPFTSERSAAITLCYDTYIVAGNVIHSDFAYRCEASKSAEHVPEPESFGLAGFSMSSSLLGSGMLVGGAPRCRGVYSGVVHTI